MNERKKGLPKPRVAFLFVVTPDHRQTQQDEVGSCLHDGAICGHDTDPNLAFVFLLVSLKPSNFP